MTIGERIKMLRKKKLLTQEEIAKQLNIGKQAIHKYENGIVTNIPLDKLETIAKILDTTPAYLMGWEDDTDTKKSPSIAERDFDSMIEDIAAGGEDREGVIMAKGGKGQKRIILTENDDEADFAAEAIRLFRRSQKKK